MAKKKWYAVTAGRDVGLFNNWLVQFFNFALLFNHVPGRLLVAPLVIGVSESHYVSFTCEEDAWKAYEEARDEGNIRILPGGAKPKSSRSPRMGGSHSQNDKNRRPSANPEPSRGFATSSGKTVPSTATVTSPETVTLVGGSSPARPASRERASSSKSAAAPHSRLSSSKDAPASPAPPTRSTKADEFVRLYVAASKAKSRRVSSSTSRESTSPGVGSSTTPVISRTRRVVVGEPSFLRPYPDEPESSDDEQSVSNADLLSPLTSPRLHTPEPYEGPLIPSSQTPESSRCRQPDDIDSLASIMSAMGLAPSQVTVGPSYDAVADPRSPLARTASIPRDRRPFGRPSPNYSLGALIGPD
ncbi:uncharacterized protein EV420DRAFT_1530112 [Desarmillaria tabescens]|uniref:Uncharacterized protein n=1 Tax=Armillaria tabescens TaxID=1929756 RepID=A0AA39N8N9_ARMTA|nr:uncharacterized protein EV420DRAFT_1530112 [Desarmillaria tabescens]KAK0461076.1 hypothetical protein EV420DRAFT_1530112 [Desarmillaria tabescens]